MTAYNRTHRTAIVWTTIFCGLFILTSARARVSVVTLSQLVDESDTIVYGSFQLTSRSSAQSPSYVEFTPKSALRGNGAERGQPAWPPYNTRTESRE